MLTLSFKVEDINITQIYLTTGYVGYRFVTIFFYFIVLHFPLSCGMVSPLKETVKLYVVKIEQVAKQRPELRQVKTQKVKSV